MEKYQILFCEDNKICFQGKDGIVDPASILCTGKILDFSDTKEIKDGKKLMYTVFESRELIFVPGL